MAMLKVLESAGYKTTEADNGQQALDIILGESIDILVTDLRLPVLDGHQVLRMLKGDSSTKDIPVVMLTVVGGETEITRSIESGAICHMEKPHQIERLLEEVRIECRRHRLVHAA